ncbi:Aste57867_8339 [Aphanomyces stellatus]|uniref:Aste57867_8339 protein n=1 Tax=Aphanomyces stellatus TaxID=120398 RepID=A0A485KK58_9STRA|nr:hypothetical protein As57867_008307 [Aphanomyces stellatus]VFT85226.1 Aste57867_8339 [Aphanomyces stellatus]
MEYETKRDSVEDLLEAAKAGLLVQMLEILDRGDVGVNALGEISDEDETEMSRTALMCASQYGRVEIVGALIDRDDIDINAVNDVSTFELTATGIGTTRLNVRDVFADNFNSECERMSILMLDMTSLGRLQ